MTRHSGPAALRVAALAGALFLLSSCFTTAVWGGSIEDDDGDGVHDVELDPEVDGVSDFLLKLVLTPFAVVLDVCTSPVQAWLYGWEDDDDC